MKRLIALPLLIAVFGAPINASPGDTGGSAEAATIAAADTLFSGGGVIAQENEADDEEDATEDTPWLVVLPLAFAMPLAVLLVPSFLRKRPAGH